MYRVSTTAKPSKLLYNVLNLRSFISFSDSTSHHIGTRRNTRSKHTSHHYPLTVSNSGNSKEPENKEIVSRNTRVPRTYDITNTSHSNQSSTRFTKSAFQPFVKVQHRHLGNISAHTPIPTVNPIVAGSNAFYYSANKQTNIDASISGASSDTTVNGASLKEIQCSECHLRFYSANDFLNHIGSHCGMCHLAF